MLNHSHFGYLQGKDDDMDWRRRSIATSTVGTGPKADHTSGKSGQGKLHSWGYIVGTVSCNVKIPLGDLHQHNLIKNGMLEILPILNTSFQKYSVQNFYTIIDRRCLGV